MRRFWGGLGVVAIGILLAVYAWWPALSAYPHTQVGDGPFFQNMVESARVSWFRWHELPLWNPYQCGGVPLWDNPQGIAASPLLWTFLSLGTSTRAIELWFVSHVVIAFVSMWLFLRHDLRLTAPSSLFGACVWAFCGYFDQHLSGGHLTWVTFAYLPLGLFLWRRAEKDARFAVGMGMLVAWEMHEGATYGLPHLAVVLGAETLTRAWPPRRMLHIARAGAIVAVVGLCLASSRLLPVIDQLRSHKRPLGDEFDSLQWSTLVDMFLARTHSRGVPGQQYVWPEFGAYVGPFVLGLAIIGVLSGGLPYTWLVALLVFSFALMMGHAGPYAPWHILKGHVYPFKQMRVPSRFNAEVTMFIAAFAAIAIDRTADRVRRLTRRVHLSDGVRTGLLVLAFVGVGDIITVGIDWTQTCFTNAPLGNVAPAAHLYVGAPGSLAQFIDQPQQGVARQECWEEWAFHRDAPLWTGDVPQARAHDPSQATVTNVRRTQNSFTFDVDAKAPARVDLDSAFDHGWRSSVGAVTAMNEDLLAVDVPVGSHHVVVKYWPHGLTLGLWLSGLAAAGIVAFFVWDRRRRNVSTLA
jgi:hypothetical protein